MTNLEESMRAIMKIFFDQGIRSDESLTYSLVKTTFLQDTRFTVEDFAKALDALGAAKKIQALHEGATKITLTPVGKDSLTELMNLDLSPAQILLAKTYPYSLLPFSE